jgi:hypothetical protein
MASFIANFMLYVIAACTIYLRLKLFYPETVLMYFVLFSR